MGFHAEAVDGVILRDEAEFGEKVGRFRELGAGALHVLLDFDRTLTVGRDGADDATTWQVLYRHLPPDGQRTYNEYYERYRPLEVAGKMTAEDAREWTSAILDLYVRHAVNLNLIEDDFLHVVSLRPGTEELFDLCRRYEVPVIILSAGIRNVVDLLLSLHGIRSAKTVSTELHVDESGTITGWDQDSLVHVFNKRENGHADLEQLRQSRPNCILAGDSILDADMVDGDDTVIRARIIDPRLDEHRDHDAVRSESILKFDMVIESRSLHPVAGLVSAVVRPPETE